MTTRKLKKLIKSEVEKIKMPDLSEQVTRQILISKANRYLENKEEIDKQRKRASFKTAALIPAFSAIIISIMVIVINLIPNGTVTSETTKRHRAYAMQAITLVNFAENYDETVNLSSKANETGLMRLSKRKEIARNLKQKRFSFLFENIHVETFQIIKLQAF